MQYTTIPSSTNKNASSIYTNNKKVAEPQQKTASTIKKSNAKTNTKTKLIEKQDVVKTETLTKDQIRARESLKKQAMVLKAILLTK